MLVTSIFSISHNVFNPSPFNFSFTHSVFYLFRELSAIFIKFKIVVCRLFQFGLKSVVWERVKFVFCKCLQFGLVHNSVTCKQFNSYPNKPCFSHVCETSLLKTLKHCGKGEIAHNEQFLLLPKCFLPVWRTFCHFHQI